MNHSRDNPRPGHGKPGTLPVLLSAAVFPGAGQLAQRRWTAGAIIGSGFLLAFAWCLVSLFRILLAYYALGFDWNRRPPGHLPVGQALIALAIGLAFYAVGILDAHRAYRRAASAWNAARRLAAFQAGPPPPPTATDSRTV